MNREQFNNIYRNELTPKQKKVLTLFLAGQSDEQIAKEIGATHRSTTSHQLRNISRKFGFPPETEPDYRCNLIELFANYNRELVSFKALEKCGHNFPSIRFPEGTEPLSSPFYIERSSVEANCFQAIQQPGALIRIKAAKQMGKTSLVKRIIAEAKGRKYHTVYLNFSLIENKKFSEQSSFLYSFSTYLANQLPSSPLGEEFPQDMIGCTAYFKKVLKQSQAIFLLALDEVDRLFEFPEIYQNFFPMLRNWNENASESEIWENLRLVIVHSTENYGKLDINKSPFNVGLPIKLDEFNEEQVKNLAIRHGLDSQDIVSLMSLVGGHPYLIRLAFYYLASQDKKIEQLLKEATTDAGIYNQHLRRHLETFVNNQELTSVFKQIVNSNYPVKLERKTQQIYQLESMGLIKILGDLVAPRCLLYQKYYQERLI
ncbi:AAA-like domain-containing protein [Chlorogloea sp. CCALA 695]|uniref:AAA-like domain-containing protein n=1 Tax=Chlorogloea sp. CCALA 695 TaxID=2107693 RepID=UPI000D07515E|nr:AAA-like domain-containing protein [Chlorogloea sp. CCALA 695]PSB26361.1 hypothetical protein C7B70_23975 [Chlorogloea sp. CCALA 695]